MASLALRVWAQLVLFFVVWQRVWMNLCTECGSSDIHIWSYKKAWCNDCKSPQ